MNRVRRPKGNAFGENLKRQRELQELTQADVAQAMSITPAAYGLWEQGRRLPDVVSFAMLCTVLSVRASTLLPNVEVRR
jgi:transcriptional regulator with XRE-family HTH domain